MSEQAVDPRYLLFTGGPRLGWAFRDRRELVPAFSEPKPGPETIQAASAAGLALAEARLDRAWTWAGKASTGLALIAVLLAAAALTMSHSVSRALLLLAGGLVLSAPGLLYAGWCRLERDRARGVPLERAYQQALGEWEQRAVSHQRAALARVAGQPEWGSVDIPPRRTDVYGGTFPGWEAFLVVHGTSLLGGGHPVLIADLTGTRPAAPLLSVASAAGVETVTWKLPRHLGRSGILDGLNPRQIASAVTEALHAGAPGGARTERATDLAIAEQLAAALAPDGITLPRLSAAVRAARGQSAGPLLSTPERERITADLFPPGSARDQAAPGLARLDAVLPGLAAGAGDHWPDRPAPCTCITVGGALRDAATEILAALLIQWITVKVIRARRTIPAVIVVGADHVTRNHLEQLTDACEARGVPVTLLFRHLRDDAVALLGGGSATAFMRLGNHSEAEQAAGYLGRHHTFAVSSFTVSRGASTTVTTGGGTGHGTSESVSDSRNRGWQSGGFLGTATGNSGGTGRTAGASTSETWSRNWSTADGVNWSEAQGLQRVYEYRVEPSVLQDLPELSLLLADRSPGALRLRAVECDPAIITLPGTAAVPLPPPPVMLPGISLCGDDPSKNICHQKIHG